ncbi:chemotaxis protein CheW [Sporomusa aerivorans]|uniref:chemotaxis protein CheW n=1 Tax=Sporomusa aerivorans TaxID=204936 RepID=UPI00352B4615
MSGNLSLEPMLDMYLFEADQLVEQLEQLVLSSEKSGDYSLEQVNGIFRIMHTIKGSSAMMLFDNIAALAHSLEDVFYYLREHPEEEINYNKLADLVLAGVDFIKSELEKIKNRSDTDGDTGELLTEIKGYLQSLTACDTGNDQENKCKTALEQAVPGGQEQYYISQNKTVLAEKTAYFRAVIFFDQGCEMENIRAFTVVHNLKEFADIISHVPEDIISNEAAVELIQQAGFQIVFSTAKSPTEVEDLLKQTLFLRTLQLEVLSDTENEQVQDKSKSASLEEQPVKIPIINANNGREKETGNAQSCFISVNVAKLDGLMDLVGELVITQAMVTQNTDLQGLKLESFHKTARHLEKMTGELQDMVMSIRMVPLATTFQKMHRIVRDMSKKLNREVRLELIGEQTEVEKNVIENISDPLMHLIRNAIDHGIEIQEERSLAGKPAYGTITLEARHAGSDVLILIKDDGRGLNKEKILERARINNLICKPESELTDKDIFSFIFLPGFSTKENVTEFSGRGVGMDVVAKNIHNIGGTVAIDSVPGAGSTITLKIPLSLAIIDGMIFEVGRARYTLPITSIRESFRPKEKAIITDPDGNEMIMLRGQCHPILRLHRTFGVQTEITKFTEGILIMVENNTRTICLFADHLVGEQPVVIKALPPYLKAISPVNGVAGCTLLGDGSISLILNVIELM